MIEIDPRGTAIQPHPLPCPECGLTPGIGWQARGVCPAPAPVRYRAYAVAGGHRVERQGPQPGRDHLMPDEPDYEEAAMQALRRNAELAYHLGRLEGAILAVTHTGTELTEAQVEALRQVAEDSAALNERRE